jgi:large subunit ribosomal protein L4
MNMAKKSTSLTLDILGLDGKKVSDLALNPEVFSIEPHTQSMFDAVLNAQSNARQSNAKTKTRAEVAGSNMKPWKQKGTGRARAGSKRSPIWVGGGVTFGPTGNENYKRSQNKKQYRLALKSALSQKFLENKIRIVQDVKLDAPKTKVSLALLKALDLTGKVMFVLDTYDENFALSVRNLNKILAVSRQNMSVLDLVNADYVVFTEASVKAIEEVLQ